MGQPVRARSAGVSDSSQGWFDSASNRPVQSGYAEVSTQEGSRTAQEGAKQLLAPQGQGRRLAEGPAEPRDPGDGGSLPSLLRRPSGRRKGPFRRGGARPHLLLGGVHYLLLQSGNREARERVLPSSL